MIVKEHIPLSSITTLRVGGGARYVLECTNKEDVVEALAFIRERSLPYMVLGEGSNVLADDAGYEGAIIRMNGGAFEYKEHGSDILLIAEAGVTWDALVTDAAHKGYWGIENLAAIPGTVGAAPIQNIGAYGMDVSETIEWVEVLDAQSEEVTRLSNAECEFAYRDSVFKRKPYFIILRVAFVLRIQGTPQITYKDLQAAKEKGVPLDTPSSIGDAVRDIRSYKFPDLRICGTAGSFFKNPIVSTTVHEALHKKYPDLPAYPDERGVKIALAWILDSVLKLKGFKQGHVGLFERQPLVLVTDAGATAHDVDVVAKEIAARVLDATGVSIEREVRAMTKNLL